MDINKYPADNNVVVKKEVEDSSEVTISPPSIIKNAETSKKALDTSYFLSPLNKPVNYGILQSSSTLPVDANYGILQSSSTLLPVNANYGILQISSTLPVNANYGILQSPSTLPVNANYDILQSSSTLPVNAFIPSLQNDMPQVASTLSADAMSLAAPEKTLQNATILPMVNKVVKPKKRAKKRYVYSKPKKRSKKKPELPTLPLLETHNKLFAKENNGEGIDSDDSSDTIILTDGDDHVKTTSTKESSSAGEVTRPLELGKLLISKGVKMLPNNYQVVQDSVESPNKSLQTLPVFESTPFSSPIKKEFSATNVANFKPSDIDLSHETSIGYLQGEKNVEMPDSQELSHLLLYNNVGKKNSGKKQTARKSRSKPNSARNSKKNIPNLTQNSLEIESATFDNVSNLLADQLETTVHNTLLNSTVSETAVKEKPKRKRPAAKRKPKNFDTSLHTDFETSEILNSNSVGGELLNEALYETVKMPKKKRSATPRKSPKKNVTAALPAEYLDTTSVGEPLFNSALYEAHKKPIRKKAATPRKSPKKKNNEIAEFVDNSNLSENASPAKLKRKRAPPKKGVQRKKTNSILEATLLDKSEVVESCLVLSVKKELDTAASFDSSFPDCSTNRSTFGSASDTDTSNLRVSLFFEEDVSRKEDHEDNASLLLAFKQRNAKGQFTKSSKSSKTLISVSQDKNKELSSNLTAKTSLSNNPECNENLRMIEKPLPLRYLSNFEATKPSITDSVNLSSASTIVSEHLKNKSINESVDALSPNLNIKKEPADTFECGTTITNSSSTAQKFNESQIPEQNLCNQPVIPTLDFAVADITSVPSTKRKQTARRGRRGTPTRHQSSRISSETLKDQSVPITPDTGVADLFSMPSTPTQKKKQTAGRRGTLTRQQPVPNSNEPSHNQSTLLSDSSILDTPMATFAVSTQRKQTARRGKKKTPGTQVHSTEAPVNMIETPNNYSSPSHLAPNSMLRTTRSSVQKTLGTQVHGIDAPVNLIEAPNNFFSPPHLAPNLILPATRSSVPKTPGTQVHSTEAPVNMIETPNNSLSPSHLAPNLMLPTTRSSVQKTLGTQVHGKEAPVNLIETPNNFSSPPQLAANLILPTTRSSAPPSIQSSNSIAQPKTSSTHLSNVIIKDEPKDPEYEIITLDDSPIKKTCKQNDESARQLHSQVPLSQVSSISTNTLVKKELFTEQDKNPLIVDHQLCTSKPTSVPAGNIESNEINASSDTLSSISEAVKIISASDKIISSVPDLGSSKNHNLESLSPILTKSFVKDSNILTTVVPPIIKREVQDSSELQKNACVPKESPSFFNCLNPISLANESQLTTHRFPVIVGSIPTNFQTAENPVNSLLSTHREVQNVIKSCTDAVYSNMLSEEIGLDDLNNSGQQIRENFQQSSLLQFPSNEQSTVGQDVGLSKVDATNFANDVSIESLKNIIGFSDIAAGAGIKETSNSTSVYSNVDKDSNFRLDDDDNSSRTSSFLSRSSPRLSTPHSDCASHRLTDSVSPLTKIPEHFGKTFAKDACFDEVTAAMEVEQIPEDESDGLTVKNVGFKLRYAASLAQNSLKNVGDIIPLNNYPVVDGEVECFHKLLLAAFVPKLKQEDRNLHLEVSAPNKVEDILSEETSVTSQLSIPNMEVNRSSLLDQFISQKIAEENSLNENQKELFYRRTPQKEQVSSFHTNEPHISSYILHSKDKLLKGSEVYVPNPSEATKYTVLSDSLSYINEEATKPGKRLDFYSSLCGETSKNAPEFGSYAPVPPGEMACANERSDSYVPLSHNLSSIHNTLPSSEQNKSPAFDLSLIPNMLKLISNLRESSSKNTASQKVPASPKIHSTVNSSNPESSNKQVEESFPRNVGRSVKGTTFELEDSKLHSISTLSSAHSKPFTETSESALQQEVVEFSNYSSQNDTDKYSENQDFLLSSNTLKNISVPSKELLFNVIKNTQLTSSNDPSCSLTNKEPNSSDSLDLVNTSNKSRAVQLSQDVAVFNSDLHNDLSNFEVMSSEVKKNLVDIEDSDVSFVEMINNVPNNKVRPISEVESISNLADTLTNLFPNTTPTIVCKEPETHVIENVTVEPVKTNPIVDTLGIADLLKILNTAKSLQSDTPNLTSQYSETINNEPSNLKNSCHFSIGYGNASSTDSRYSYPETYQNQYSNYSGGDSMEFKMPIIHEYDHKPRTDSYDQGSSLGAALAVNKDTVISNADIHSKNLDSSDSDVDNDILNNETDLVEDSVSEETDEKKQPNKSEEVSSIDEPHDFPQYKSRWERIMERKNQANDRAKLNEHLLEDYYSVKVPKSKPKIQKPIAHVQPCSQKSPKKKIIKKKAASEQSSLPLKKMKGNQTESISTSNLPKSKKTKKAEIISPSAPSLKKKKSNNGASKNVKVGEDNNKQKKKADNIETPLASGPPPKKMKGNDTKIISPKFKKSKECKGTTKKQNDVKSKQARLEVPSELFAPDKIVVKRKDVKHSDVKKADDEASKRLYGRVTNRGSFLTESSLTQPPKPKTHLGRMGSDKNKGSRIFADELHSMVATPEIQIGLENEHLPKQSKKLSLEAYKRKKHIFNDPNIGAMSPKVDLFSANFSNRHISNNSNVFNDLSPDISYQASSDSSDFLSPPDSFASNISSLPHLESDKSHFSHTVFSTVVNNSPAVNPFSFTRRTLLPDPVPGFKKRSLLPDPMPSFKEGSSSNDFEMEAQSSHIMSPLFTNPSSNFLSSSHNLTPQPVPPVTKMIPQPVPPVTNMIPQPIPPVSNFVPQPVASPSVASFPSRNHHRLPRSRQTRCVCLPPKTLKASVGQAVFETFNVLLLILEWNVDWLVQQQKCLDPPPICNTVKKVVNKYEDLEDYYNTYLPLLLLETWQRIYASWTHLHQASPYFCKITSYTVETHTIKVECEAVFRSSDAEKGLVPEKGNIIMIKFGTKEKGGIKILGYVTNVKVTAFDPVSDPQNTCYRTLKYTATEVLQRLTLTFVGAYNSEDFDQDLLIRIQVLCNIKSILKQNDAMLNIKNSPLYTNILNPLNDGLRTVNVITKHADPLKVSETVSDCVRDIVKGILSPHPLPLLTIAKSLPSSDRLLVLLPLIEKMKNSYKTKVLLCTRTAKALNDIGFHLEGGALKVVIIGNRADIHQKLKKYFLDDLAFDKANSCLNIQTPEIPGFQESASKDAVENAKINILKECDVILSNIRSCHNDFIVKACEDGDCIPQLCCIVDEANLCTEPEILIPLLYGISKLILIGDPDVYAKVCSKTAISYGYNRSIFHRANELDLASE